jgi:hypothetical protein
MKQYNENCYNYIQPLERVQICFSCSHQNCRYVPPTDQKQTRPYVSRHGDGDLIGHVGYPVKYKSPWFDAYRNY